MALVLRKAAKDCTRTRMNISRERRFGACVALRFSASLSVTSSTGDHLFLWAPNIIALRHDNTQNSGMTMNAGKSGKVNSDRLNHCRKGE